MNVPNLVQKVEQVVQTLKEYPNANEFEYYSFGFGEAFNSRIKKQVEVLESMVKLFEGKNGVKQTDLLLNDNSMKDAIQALRESSNILADEIRGLGSKVSKVSTTKLMQSSGLDASASKKIVKHANLAKKPQTLFPDYPIDNSRSAFVPKIHDVNKKNQYHNKNPYQKEIMQSLHTVPSWVKNNKTLVFPVRKKNGNSLAEVPFKLVETKSDFAHMLQHLYRKENKHLILAIDLEHHNYHSYLGFTCVMQLSTPEMDFVIDTLALRGEMHQLLDLFVDETVVKVLHGSDYDVEWLQKDFGLFLVQMFDTGQAARVLGYESASLAFALNKHTDVIANKAYQLSDWRLRPMTVEMIQYAREDTHWLIHVFDLIRVELLNSKQLEVVFRRSAEIACKTFEKPIFSLEDCFNLISGNKREFNSKQINCLKSLYDWRDATARREDESCASIMTDKCVVQIAKDLPLTVEALLNSIKLCMNYLSSVLKNNLYEISALINQISTTTQGNVQKLLVSSSPSNENDELEDERSSFLLLDGGKPSSSSSQEKDGEAFPLDLNEISLLHGEEETNNDTVPTTASFGFNNDQQVTKLIPADCLHVNLGGGDYFNNAGKFAIGSKQCKPKTNGKSQLFVLESSTLNDEANARLLLLSVRNRISEMLQSVSSHHENLLGEEEKKPVKQEEEISPIKKNTSSLLEPRVMGNNNNQPLRTTSLSAKYEVTPFDFPQPEKKKKQKMDTSLLQEEEEEEKIKANDGGGVKQGKKNKVNPYLLKSSTRVQSTTYTPKP